MRMRLSRRINLYIGLILLLGVGILSYHQALFHSRFAEDAGVSEARRLGVVVFDGLYSAMKLGQGRVDNRDAIERLKKIEGVREIRIIHSPLIDRQYGREEDEGPVDELDRSALGGMSVSEVSDKGEWIARFVMPVFVQEECRQCHIAGVGDVNGAISVRISLEQYRGFIATSVKWFLLLGGATFLLTTGSLLFVVRKRFLNPLNRLEKGAEALAQGDFTYRADISTGDEMEDVGGAFDRMAATLSEKTAELRELGEKHSKLIEMAADAIILHDIETGRIMEANPAAEALTGYSRSELLGMDAMELHPREKADEHRSLWKRWTVDGRGYFYEAAVRRKGGAVVPVEIAASVVEFGGRRYLQQIWRDLFERKGFAEALRKYAEGLEEKVRERTKELEEACAKLKESEKTLIQTAKLASLGEMGAGVAHELNSPLAGILSITEVLLNRTAQSSESHYMLEKLKDAAVRSKNIISDILTYSRPSKVEASPLSVNDAIKSTLSLFTSEIKTASMEIREELAAHLPLVLGNKGQLMEVFLNVIRNARDAMGGSGVLTIRTRSVVEGGRDWVAIEIEDTGPGIPDEIKDKVFDPFFKGSVTMFSIIAPPFPC
ncbi:MAG: PAS domain S-box protein [Deltaproteobacteria bacterium]|nr:PAS domain S-box protein [Deltaproteobacteria bacterium]